MLSTTKEKVHERNAVSRGSTGGRDGAQEVLWVTCGETLGGSMSDISALPGSISARSVIMAFIECAGAL